MNRSDTHLSLAERLLARVTVSPAGCWEWQRALDIGGYGRFKIAGRRSYCAHRIAYETFVGPIPAGLSLDHSQSTT